MFAKLQLKTPSAPDGAWVDFGLRFDHLGLAMREPKKTLSFLRGLGYRTPPFVHDPLQGVNLVLCEHSATPAEEVSFAAGPSDPLDAILAPQPQAFHHLCFRSSALDDSLAAMKAAGHIVLVASTPKPAVLFRGMKGSFFVGRDFGLIEFIEQFGMTGRYSGIAVCVR
jgi:catechol 2,3-dioxygenase-like lactoylglutathione lyase family enzyme